MYKAVVKPMSKHSLHHSRPITHCQSCGEKGLVPHIFLGSVPLVNHMHPIGTIADAEMRFPLELVHCESCGLCQIGYEVDQQLLFPYSYPYLSGTTQILIDNFQDLAEEVSQLLPFQSGEKVRLELMVSLNKERFHLFNSLGGETITHSLGFNQKYQIYFLTKIPSLFEN